MVEKTKRRKKTWKNLKNHFEQSEKGNSRKLVEINEIKVHVPLFVFTLQSFGANTLRVGRFESSGGSHFKVQIQILTIKVIRLIIENMLSSKFVSINYAN